jgi:molybdopterin/thiamine biosynthesis adenylyltransferase
MNDEQLLRYSRHLMLANLDVDGQEKLLASTVLIVGLGGLGCPVAMYLAAAGVGRLILVDDDKVDLGNLQRQIAHVTAGVGRNKAESARDTLQALNPGVATDIYKQRLEGAELERVVAGCDAVVDCTDNFTTRFALNRACVKHRVPLISGAAIRMEGQLSVFDSRRPESPCYHCLYEEGDDLDASCANNGVMAPLVGVIGSLQALECIKVLAGTGTPLCGRLLLFDATGLQFREMQLRKNPECPVCRDTSD